MRANFGPEFVYPPPSSLRWKPIANLKPLSKDEIKVRYVVGENVSKSTYGLDADEDACVACL